MAYRRSVYRVEFEIRIEDLLEQSKTAQNLTKNLGDQQLSALRDMVFQCAIFQTSAALESYLKLILESWSQSLRINAMGTSVPMEIRALFARKRLNPHFRRYLLVEEEAALHRSIAEEADLWDFLGGGHALPPFFDGRAIHEACAYPSYKNIKRLFGRIGIADIEAKLSRVLRRDLETLIGSFQDLRTALAHSAPPRITMKDVRERLKDQVKLVSAIDKILFNHVMSHGGAACWAQAA